MLKVILRFSTCNRVSVRPKNFHRDQKASFEGRKQGYLKWERAESKASNKLQRGHNKFIDCGFFTTIA